MAWIKRLVNQRHIIIIIIEENMKTRYNIQTKMSLYYNNTYQLRLVFSWRKQTRWSWSPWNYWDNGMKSTCCYLWFYLSSFWKRLFASKPVPVVDNFSRCNTTHSSVHYYLLTTEINWYMLNVGKVVCVVMKMVKDKEFI